VKQKWIGFNPPFFGGQLGVFSPQTDERLIKNDLRQLLLTSPGERAYRPDFGTIIQGAVFEPGSSSLQLQIQSSVMRAISKWEKRVTVNSVTVTPVPNTNLMAVIVNVSLVTNPNSNFTVQVQLPTQG
jgi:hypothetical protein